MVDTNPTELTDAFIKCRDKPNYSVGIIFGDAKRRKEFMEQCRDSELEARINVRKGTIKFKNGSSMTAILDWRLADYDADEFYKLEFNQFILDCYCSQDFKDSFLEPLLVPYVSGEDNTLNDFLDEFVIQ